MGALRLTEDVGTNESICESHLIDSEDKSIATYSQVGLVSADPRLRPGAATPAARCMMPTNVEVVR